MSRRVYYLSIFILLVGVIGGGWAASQFVIGETLRGIIITIVTGAIMFASTSPLQHAISGVGVAAEVKVGDKVRIGDAQGRVRSFGLTRLRIVTRDKTLISLPYGSISDSAIHNYSEIPLDEVTVQIHVGDFGPQYSHESAETVDRINDFVSDLHRVAKQVQDRYATPFAIAQQDDDTLLSYPFANYAEFAGDSDLFTVVLLKKDEDSERAVTSDMLLEAAKFFRPRQLELGQTADVRNEVNNNA